MTIDVGLPLIDADAKASAGCEQLLVVAGCGRKRAQSEDDDRRDKEIETTLR